MPVQRGHTPPVRPDPRFCAIVLAAGAGRRFGGAKLSAPWRGGVLLEGALAAAFAAPAERVIVVTGGDPAVAPAAEAFACARGEAGRLELRHAPDWDQGLSASLREGLRAAPAAVEGGFIFLGDMPEVPHTVASLLADAFDGTADAAQPSCAGAPGHPVLLAARLFAKAMRLTGDRGAQALLQRPGAVVVRVEVGAPGVTQDVDTPDALARLAGAR